MSSIHLDTSFNFFLSGQLHRILKFHFVQCNILGCLIHAVFLGKKLIIFAYGMMQSILLCIAKDAGLNYRFIRERGKYFFLII